MSLSEYSRARAFPDGTLAQSIGRRWGTAEEPPHTLQCLGSMDVSTQEVRGGKATKQGPRTSESSRGEERAVVKKHWEPEDSMGRKVSG